MNNNNSRNIVLNIDDTFNNLKLKSVSYSLYKALLCPVKYYFQYIVKEDITNYYIIKGIAVHTLYEKALLQLKQENRTNYFKNVNEIQIYEIIQNIIEGKNEIRINEYTLNKLIQDIKKNLNQSFINFIKRKLEKGWKLYIEQPNKNTEALYILNSYTDLYTKADIILKLNDKIEVIDIKTGNIHDEYIKQVIFYLYSYFLYSKEKSKNSKTYIGSIYSTKLNQYRVMLYTNEEYIQKKFNSYIQEVNEIYNLLNINNVNDIKVFVENYLTTGNYIPDEAITLIRKLNNCNFCPLKDKCPIINKDKFNEFKNYISNLPISEKIIHIQEPKENLDLNIFNRR